MKFKPWYLIIFFVFAFIIYVSIPDNTASNQQKANQDSISVLNERKQKDETFKELDDSPIKNKSSFKGLKYFPYASKWKIKFKVEKLKKSAPISIQMTDGTVEKMIFFAIISFDISGNQVNLHLYQHDNGNFFLAFKDLTSARETYGGGRYIDIPADQLQDQSIQIDFNQAYFPYCAYDASYACPVPPQNNYLPMRILAGERL